jgi:hypothetical protein
MVVKEEVLSSLSPCSRPPIIMGDDTLVVLSEEGRVELHNGSFENVLHVPKLSMNLLSVYQITQKGKKVEFTSNSISVIGMHDNSIIAIGEVDHKSRLYIFTNFFDDDSYFLLTHKESTLHAPRVQHAYTLVLPSVSDIKPCHVPSSSEPLIPMHCYMVQSSGPQLYIEVVGNPLWKVSMQKKYDSLLNNQT